MLTLRPRAAVLLCAAAVTAVSLPTGLAFGAAKVYNPTNPSDVWNLNANWGILSGGTGSSVTPNQGVPTATDSSGDSADFRLEGIPAPLQSGPISVDTVTDLAEMPNPCGAGAVMRRTAATTRL